MQSKSLYKKKNKKKHILFFSYQRKDFLLSVTIKIKNNKSAVKYLPT